MELAGNDSYLASHILNLVIVSLVSLFLFARAINLLPLTDRDEALYVQASRQMLETGDWIDIRFQQEPRYKKPVGDILAARHNRQTDRRWRASPLWVYRLPSLRRALLTVCFPCDCGPHGRGECRADGGASCRLDNRTGNSKPALAKLMPCCVATLVAAQFGLLCAYLDRKETGAVAQCVFWLAMGLGTLIKGPVGL